MSGGVNAHNSIKIKLDKHHRLLVPVGGFNLNDFTDNTEMEMKFGLQYPERHSKFYVTKIAPEGNV